MMTNSELNAYISTIDWTQESLNLRDFAQKFHLPQVGKITKGQFECIGIPSISSPYSKSLILWFEGGKILKIAASCVKFKEERNHLGYSHFKMIPFGSKFAIPSNYNGYFEILSEEGKSVKCIESARELFKRFPSQVLCRDDIKVYLASEHDEQVISQKSRILKKGDVLKLLSPELITIDHWTSSSFNLSEPSNHSSKETFYKPHRFLKCLSSSNDIVFLNLESKCKFSQIDKEDSISGVHTISSLLSKRLPLMVRLIHSAKPNGFKWLVPEMRLYSVFEEDYLIGMPLHKNSSIISVPLNAPLKVVGPKNCEQILNYSIFSKLNQRYEKIKSETTNRIQIYHSSLISKDLKNKWLDVNHNLNCKKKYQTIHSSSQHKENDTNIESSNRIQNKSYYDEIDQIYDYIRGLAPLPDKYRSNTAKMNTYLEPKLSYASLHDMIDSFDELCNRKSSEDHCSLIQVSANGQAYFSLKGQTYHSTKPKLFINRCKVGEPCEVKSLPKLKKMIKLTQNVSSNDHRINGFISNKLTCPRINTRTHSSLFNIRYKSLNNIHFINPMNEYSKNYLNRTLGSCNSSGRASIGSGYSEDLHKYKSVKRPILLSNLFWKETNDEFKFDKLDKGVDLPVFNHKTLNDCFKNLYEISMTSQTKHLGTLYL